MKEATVMRYEVWLGGQCFGDYKTLDLAFAAVKDQVSMTHNQIERYEIRARRR